MLSFVELAVPSAFSNRPEATFVRIGINLERRTPYSQGVMELYVNNV
jgi:hypothetical protein